MSYETYSEDKEPEMLTETGRLFHPSERFGTFANAITTAGNTIGSTLYQGGVAEEPGFHLS
jgi:hypothetical protein